MKNIWLFIQWFILMVVLVGGVIGTLVGIDYLLDIKPVVGLVVAFTTICMSLALAVVLIIKGKEGVEKKEANKAAVETSGAGPFLHTNRGSIWCPPGGKPYWVSGPKIPRPSLLTDEEMERYFGGESG